MQRPFPRRFTPPPTSTRTSRTSRFSVRRSAVATDSLIDAGAPQPVWPPGASTSTTQAPDPWPASPGDRPRNRRSPDFGPPRFDRGARNGRPSLRPRVGVVIPTLNEAENLPHVLPALPADLYEVILVDGHSTDGTVEVARALRPDIRVVFDSRRGKGSALAAGFAVAAADVIVTLDADGSADPEEIASFVQALVDGADFAKGTRFRRGGGSADLTVMRRLGNGGLNRLVNVLFHAEFTDLCYGYNAFWRDCLPALSLDCSGFEVETLLHIRAIRAGLLVAEVPSFERRRISGTSHLRPVRDGFRILSVVVRERRASASGDER